MKRIFFAKTFVDALNIALNRYPKYFYVTGKKVKTRPNAYEITLKLRKRKKYKPQFLIIDNSGKRNR